jgi:NAD(P)-dependent dehydrogenase (short-subunit alcohol dehydrogenase family)
VPDPSPPVHVLIGATGGIGSATARRLAARGCRLVLAARREEALHDLAGELDAEAHVLDATDGAAVDALFAGAAQRHGRVDGAVNLAGSLLLKPAHRTSDAEWDATIAANLTTAFHTVRGAAKVMQRTGGSVVLLASAVARVGMSNHEAIAAAKAGVIGLTLAAAASYAQKGIRVNAVAPGMTGTPMTAKLTADATSRAVSAKLHPLGTIGTPGEVASAIVWLLDAEQRVVTGQTLGVDGGLGTVHARQ